MDPFTERMLERAKRRREILNQHFSKNIELGQRRPLSETNKCKNINNDQSKPDDSPIKQSIAQSNEGANSEDVENVMSFRQGFKSRGEPVLECIGSMGNEDNDDLSSRPCKFGRLAALATKIKEWEDEVDKPKPSSSNENYKVNEKKNVVKPVEKQINNIVKPISPIPPKQQQEKKPNTQESQGYALSRNESRLIYDFEHRKEDSPKAEEPSKAKPPLSPCKRLNPTDGGKEGPAKKGCGNSPRINNENRDSAVLKKAAFFEAHHKSSPVRVVEKDPTELSIAERKALFERNGGEALLPKVAFRDPLPAKIAAGAATKSMSGRNSDIAKPDLGAKKVPFVRSMNSKPGESTNSPIKQIRTLEKLELENKVKAQRAKFEKVLDLEKPKDASHTAELLKREKELEYLRSRWDHNKNFSEKGKTTIPEPPPMPATLIASPMKVVEPVVKHRVEPVPEPEPEPQPQPVVKHKVDPLPEPKPEVEVKAANTSGKLYPSLSEFEESEDSDRTPSDSDSMNESKNSNIYLNMTFSDILEAKKNDPISSNENSFNAELKESQVLRQMDEFLDNALDDLSSTDNSDNDEDRGASPPKMLKSSSFEYKSNSDQDSNNPLVHTVSFYRRQQQTSNQSPTPVKSIKRQENVVQDVSVEEEEDVLVANKVQELLQEISKQETIISQASQALNLCLSTVEFSGSGEQVESESILLLANHKRQACLNEIQRLKVENTIRPKGSNQQLTERGDVVIKNIAIPLKREALRAMAAVESMQYLLCLIKSDERVVATPAVPATRENLKNMVLCFPGQYKLENLLSDFKVTIEVYNLELNKEMLPHEVKYHLVNKKDKKLLTPIKSKKTDSKLVMPYIQSPAGPNAVRTSNFHMCGYLVFSLRDVGRTNWTLNKVPYTSPLEGSFTMNIQSQLQLDMEFRGFLTMFDDISGFGAWHRRWCLLSSHTLSYWKYPDDETRKVPMETIDLRGVITENVGLVSRDICARLHTFLLETTRPRLPNDKDSLVLNVEGDVTRIRYLLSADSKEEMLLWCRKINTTLALLRSWRCNFGV